MTDDEIAAIFWRDTTKGTSDPFCWNGDTMMCCKVLAGVFVKGYRAAQDGKATRLAVAAEDFISAYRAKYQNTGTSNFRRNAPLYKEAVALNAALREK